MARLRLGKRFRCHHSVAMRLVSLAVVLLTLTACDGRPAKTAPSASGTAPVPVQPAPVKAVTLEDTFAAAAPGGRPAEPRWDEVLPGMDVAAIAERVGAPDLIKHHNAAQEARWRTGPLARDPDFVVWIMDGVAIRMRFRDRL